MAGRGALVDPFPVSQPEPRRPLGASFRRVWLAVGISSTGDGMFLTAFPLLAASLTRDAFLIAGVTIASRLPWLVFSLVAGAIADRVDRRRLMVTADVARCVVVGAFGIVVLEHWAQIWLLYVCAFGLGVGETLHASGPKVLTLLSAGLLVAVATIALARGEAATMAAGTGQDVVVGDGAVTNR